MSRRAGLERCPVLLAAVGITVAVTAPYGALVLLEALAVEVGLEAVLAAVGVLLVVALEALLVRLPEQIGLLCVPASASTGHAGRSARAGRVVGVARVRGPPVPALP